MTKHSPFRYFKTSPEVIRLAVMMYVRFPLSLRNVEDLLHERGIDVSDVRSISATNAFKKALDKLTGVYQSRTSSGMQWSGIQPVMQF